ncbi:energy-coupling factor ABC transporter ATP-binding protein [Trichlorobacter ammonificans]|uniref:ABC transporter ATP-binding protein n=1 Tax=Trichlorobacter ammonificans TaxID=2916410 RepID=A0ABM9D415_9BACT|nr:ABC transporter ATP-binding protein [Trichlorobacter ammonificans]CAH2029958.1 ABC transporter ATP-binding protein [Trichlorobacter ammonificans]
MSHHLVEVRQLQHRYPDGSFGINAVSFRIEHGEAVAIIGANGAGKSTLLQHLNGTLVATAGQVRIGDGLLTPATLSQVRRSVGMVFQNPDDQLFMATVGEDVAFGPLNLGLSGEELEARVVAALGQVDARHLRHKAPYHLSGGEKKRAAIATVLAMMPDVLVMDEPTGGLDPFSRRQVMHLLAGFSHTRIVASHDLDMVLELFPRTIILCNGEVAADGPTRDIFRDRELLARCRLEQPLAMQGCPVCRGGC